MFETLRIKSKNPNVLSLNQLLLDLEYKVNLTDSFDELTIEAVKNFQLKNALISDGICGQKTWLKLLSLSPLVIEGHKKLLSENDLQQFAQKYDIELAAIKAVNAVESRGKGFLENGKPKILFEGHIFWKELQKRGIDPKQHDVANNADVLFPKTNDITRKHYRKCQYERIEKAALLDDNPLIKEAAQASASWGLFQIMGFNYKSLGYDSIATFVEKMNLHENEHLAAFGKFLEVNDLIKYLKQKNWKEFAKRYNGPGYAKNQYDVKLDMAYKEFSA